MSISRRIPLAVAVVFLAASARSTASAQSASATNVTIDLPIDAYAYNPCQGERVHVVGTQHLARTSITRGSSTLMVLHISYSNTTGTGMTTGDKYVLSTAAQEILRVDEPVWTEDFVSNGQLIGEGTTPNLGLHTLQTFSFDGSHYTSTTKKYEVTCR